MSASPGHTIATFFHEWHLPGVAARENGPEPDS
jgi:hypothetical protein